MKKSVLLAVLIVGIALLTTGCDLFGGKADYFPMGVGSIWNYSWKVTVDDSTMATGTSKTETVKEDELASGEKAVMVVHTSNGSTDTSYARKDGEKVLSYEDKSDTNPSLMLDGPLAKDKTWTVSTGVTAKVLDQEDVTVTAGTYKKCWKVATTTVIDADTSVMHQWYADGTGIVKMYAEEEESGMTMKLTVELTSATIK